MGESEKQWVTLHAFASPAAAGRPIDTSLEVIRRVTTDTRRWFSGSRGFRMATIARIPVYVTTSWLFVAVILLFSYATLLQYRVADLPLALVYLLAAVSVGLVLGSVLLHELAHAALARCFGVPVDAVTLWMLGGYTQMRRKLPTPRAEFLVAAAGPVTSALLAGIGATGAALDVGPPWLAQLCGYLALTNFMISVFNALPGLPLDGGAMVRAVLWACTGNQLRATVAAARSGQVVAVVLLGFALGLLYSDVGVNAGMLVVTFVVPFFLWASASHAVRRSHITARIQRLSARDLATSAALVSSGTSLADALRAAENTTSGTIVVRDEKMLLGVVPEAVVTATPACRHDHLTVAALTRSIDHTAVLPAQATGEQLLELLTSDSGVTVYVVTEGSELSADAFVGVLSERGFAHAAEPPWQLRSAIGKLARLMKPTVKKSRGVS
jgi:Zn-dependent protease